MSNRTKVALRLNDGLQLAIEVTDYDRFVTDVQYRTETTIVVDEATGLNIFALSIATFRKDV